MEKIKFIFLVKYKYFVTNMYAWSSIGINIMKHPDLTRNLQYLPRKRINIIYPELLGIFLIDRWYFLGAQYNS